MHLPLSGLLVVALEQAVGKGGIATGINYGTFLSDWWVQGTPGDVLDFAYVK